MLRPDAHKIDWLGSEYFLDTPGYYDDLYAGWPIPGFPYDAERDEARPNTGPGRPGVPSCKQWWSDSDAGLYTRLHDEVDTGFWDGFRSVYSVYSGRINDAEDEVIRRLIQQRSGSTNGNQQTAVIGYGNVDPGSCRNVDNLARFGDANIISIEEELLQ